MIAIIFPLPEMVIPSKNCILFVRIYKNDSAQRMPFKPVTIDFSVFIKVINELLY